MRNAWAIGLYSYSGVHPGADGFHKFYERVLSVFREVGIQPTDFAADGIGYKGNATKFGGRAHAQALKSVFQGIQVMSLIANPELSEKPGYDAFATASLAYVDEAKEALLCFMMEDRLLQFGEDAFERVLRSLIDLSTWDFGYALSQPVEQQPELHVLGVDGGKLGAEELRRLNAWYSALPTERLRKIRDIYPFIILSGAQLANQLPDSRSLAEFINATPGSVLTPIEGNALWMWKIQPNAVGGIRDLLSAGNILIT